MDFKEYERLAMRTKDRMDGPSKGDENDLLEGLMGLNGEAGEAIEILKKHKFQGHPYDFFEERIVEELGDCLWYITEAAQALRIPLEVIALCNIDKLERRFPNGFTAKDSIERRDHDTDRKPDL